jgi:hypothetical protein
MIDMNGERIHRAQHTECFYFWPPDKPHMDSHFGYCRLTSHYLEDHIPTKNEKSLGLDHGPRDASPCSMFFPEKKAREMVERARLGLQSIEVIMSGIPTSPRRRIF